MSIYSHHFIGNIPRGNKLKCPIRFIDYAAKTKDVFYNKRVYQDVNFSFVLEGSGTLEVEGKKYKVVAPCVLIQWPETPFTYGPDEYWNELYFVYPSTAEEQLSILGFLDKSQPIWQITSKSDVLKEINELNQLLLQNDHDRNVDLIDLQCLKVIASTHKSSPNNNQNEIVESLRKYISANYQMNINYEKIMGTFGVSAPTLRRYWNREVEISPLEFQMRLKVREACKLLAEDNKSIKEISFILNFSDSFYFSKVFKKVTGESPTSYRKKLNISV